MNGEIYGTYPLEKDQTIEVTEGEFHNVIRIEDGQAYMEEADCPDGYCKEQAFHFAPRAAPIAALSASRWKRA